MANAVLFNNTLGEVYPIQEQPDLPDKDAREYALERLQEYLSTLVFRRTGGEGQRAKGFKIPKDDIHIFQPDDLVNATIPGIGIIPGRATHETYGLGPPSVIDGTEGVLGPGTALLRLADHIETITLEAWGSHHPERLAILSGLKQALRANDGSSSIWLSLPDYFGMAAEFAMMESQPVDGDEVLRNRRRGHIFVRMQVCEAIPVLVRQMNASLQTTVLDGNLYPTLESVVE